MPDAAVQASSAEGEVPFVSVAVPVLNESHYIQPCLESLRGQWPEGRFEVLVLDGGSRDDTREKVEAMMPGFPGLRLLDNPRRLQSAAVNLAARLATPEAGILVRADAHAVYPPDFLVKVVGALRSQRGATSVVVPMVTEGRIGLQRAIAAAQNSRFGNGGSAHRRLGQSRWVDHGHHAAFDRAFFLSIGGYDETFTHNEDAELDQRATAAGGKVWMCAEAAVTYFPRRDLVSLGRQYSRHGAGRARTILKHRLKPKPRQMAPVVALLGNSAALVAAPVVPATLLVPAVYALLCLGWGARSALRERDAWLLAAGPAAMTMHHAWAVGFLRSLMRRRNRQVATSP
ncbi:glycosyltransferase family 2 protein [Roseomonas sp. OT10]|uniref:glycosyltransferase family 2 protein n=1 Tax=Roseomonas cutis TaxID=2897332 RepID=UPI001E6140A2|nr:glycosyltransferase family 2 protein [Roseomonas sp. OT10]UFN50478.1 glycosyltransferase family 2 protein [Roseomonas sp. OT10]